MHLIHIIITIFAKWIIGHFHVNTSRFALNNLVTALLGFLSGLKKSLSNKYNLYFISQHYNHILLAILS